MGTNERSFPWDDLNGDRQYNSDDFAEFFATLFKPGVVATANSGSALQITESASLGMRIKFCAGEAFSGFGRNYIHDKDEEVIVPIASTLQDRTDSAVIQFNKSHREGIFLYKEGDITVTRTDTIFELQIAKILIPKNSTQVTKANITDMRANEAVCGYVSPHGKLNVGDIDAQYVAWFENFKGKLGTDPATNLQMQVDGKATDDKVVHLDGDETITGKKTFTDKATFTDITVSKIESLDDTDIATINATNAPSAKVSYMRRNGTVHITAGGNWGTFEKGKGLAKATLPAGFRPPVEWGAGIGPMGGNSGLTASIGTNGVLTISSSEAGTEYGAFSMSYPAAN